jgi:biopolymer transport protein ExbD
LSKKKVHVEEEVSPNLIPMVDLMFLLLLFFMLGADMGQRELEEVFLPKAIAIKEDKGEKGSTVNRLTVNVYHRYSTEVPCPRYANQEVCRDASHWRIGIAGKDYTDPRKLEDRLKIESGADPSPPVGVVSKKPRFSERGAMVRGDQSAPYRLVQNVINMCAKAGIYKIEVGAARPPDKPRNGESVSVR